jgi:hypothetical protein
MQIADEGAVGTLLDVIQQNAKRRRRVVFFCACPTPRDHGRLGCHRDRVAELLVHRAKRAGTTLEVVEWPGGRAAELEILVNPSALVALHRGAQTVRLPKRAADRVAHVPLGSTVTLRAGDAVQPVLVDSLIYRRGWQLKVFTPVSPKDTLAELRADSRRLRRELGRLERRT